MAIMFVGDPAQSIYGWNDARPDLMLNVQKILPSMQTHFILKNYRSPKELVELTNEFREVFADHGIPNSPSEPHLASQPDTVEFKEFYNQYQEVEWVAQQIRRLRDSKDIPFKSMAILARTNYALLGVERSLIAYKIPYTLKYDNRSLTNKSPFKFVYSLYSIIKNPKDYHALYEVLSAIKGVGEKFLEEVRKICEEEVTAHRDIYSDFPAFAMRFKQKKTFQTVCKIIENFINPIREFYIQPGFSTQALNNLIATTLVSKFTFEDYSPSKSKNLIPITISNQEFITVFQLLQQIFDFLARDFADKAGLDAFEEFYEALQLSQEVTDEMGRDKDHIVLSTIHSYKGLENDYIFFVNTSTAREINADDFEEKCCFYVAISRAKRKLFITSAKQVSDYSGKLVQACVNPFCRMLFGADDDKYLD